MTGANLRLPIDVKKVHNGKFWNGLRDQLPSNLISDDTKEGWFVAVRYRDAKSSDDRVRQLPAQGGGVAEKTQKSLHFMTVDARKPPSASKIRGS